jgi:CRISPR-associated protein Cmr3
LKLRGPYLAEIDYTSYQLQRVLFPQPLDLVRYERVKNRSDYGLLEVTGGAASTGQDQAKLLTNLPKGLRLLKGETDRTILDQETGYLDRVSMEIYLAGESSPPITSGEVLAIDPRIGIGMTPAYVSREGQFYTLEGRQYRPGFGLAAEVDDPQLQLYQARLAEALLFLGGERRFSQASLISEGLAPDPPAELESTTNFKLYLSTPAIFKRGWLPGWLGEDGTVSLNEATGLKIELVAAAIGRAVYFSGFDQAEKRPKPIRRAVPAGSVYYFQLLEGTLAQLKAVFHNKAVSDLDQQAGFGVSFLGVWK